MQIGIDSFLINPSDQQPSQAIAPEKRLAHLLDEIEFATLDLISQGRIEMILGLGYSNSMLPKNERVSC